MTPQDPGTNQDNELVRAYVLARDKHRCQWPGCGDANDIQVLLVKERNGKENDGQFDNGITFCRRHIDMVMLDDKTFAPLVFDLLQLVEFENDLRLTERTYKGLLGE